VLGKGELYLAGGGGGLLTGLRKKTTTRKRTCFLKEGVKEFLRAEKEGKGDILNPASLYPPLDSISRGRRKNHGWEFELGGVGALRTTFTVGEGTASFLIGRGSPFFFWGGKREEVSQKGRMPRGISVAFVDRTVL